MMEVRLWVQLETVVMNLRLLPHYVGSPMANRADRGRGSECHAAWLRLWDQANTDDARPPQAVVPAPQCARECL